MLFKDKDQNGKLIDKVVEQYHAQGIKLPYDVIEELEYNKRKMNNEKYVINFIEISRKNWKYEMMKKASFIE